ncbi:hypothetical protein H5410_021872 [Solanum commersonii]|uniref:Uncharacterized protein n=1 Tax=Solanum commersonii TaxID=4109 RepID=A0A9J5ZF71_SOLCO|nr:hypothetical protein H5410_021872 [Solanum commersonii]
MAIKKDRFTGGFESYTWNIGGSIADILGYPTHLDNDKESWGGVQRDNSNKICRNYHNKPRLFFNKTKKRLLI